MGKFLLLLSASAVVLLVLATAATAQTYAQSRAMATETTFFTATEAASKPLQPCSRQGKPTERPSLAASYTPTTLALVRQPCFQYLRQTGGLPLVAPLALGALVVLVGSGVVMRYILRG